MPSSSWWTCRARPACCRLASRASVCWSTAAPAPHDTLHVDRRARAPDREQARLRLRRRDARQGADLRVGELAPRHRLGQDRQRPEGTRHPDVLPGGAGGEADAPSEPLGAGAEAVGPAPAGVELTDQREQARRRRLEMRRELGDLVTEAIQLRNGRRRGLHRERTIRRVCRHGESPFSAGMTLTPGFGGLWSRPRCEKAGRSMIARRRCRDRGSRGALVTLRRHSFRERNAQRCRPRDLVKRKVGGWSKESEYAANTSLQQTAPHPALSPEGRGGEPARSSRRACSSRPGTS